MPRRLRALLAALLMVAGTAACAGSRAGAPGAGASGGAGEEPAAGAGGPDAAAGGAGSKKDDPLFPASKAGWAHADRATRERAAALAADYLPFLDRARTPRRAIAALVELYRAAGAVPLEGGLPAGGRAYWIAPGGDAALLLLAGRGGAAAGIRAAVAAVDGPRIDLKQVPLYRHDRLAMLETSLYGDITLESWLVRPLALHVRVARPGAPARELVVGEAPGDPVLMIPDLLIHLSGKVQARAPVDTAERMDAIAAQSSRALTAALRAAGIAPADLATAEAYLVPAERAVLAGVDGAMVAGYAQSVLAPAWAATRALAAAEPGEASAAV
ncbi:MAG TPA: hypothetical protein VKZ63_18370, partial [Kofleriaceae bacterium]|nr:hypothetical protein [Kofleriaceae bacterium]